MAKNWIDYREASRRNWGTEKEDNIRLNMEQINCGALLRIADATELMAKNYAQLQSDLERYKRWYNDSDERNTRLRRTNQALRGHLTRLGNQIEKETGPKFI
jgi:hypothetical protein